MAPGSRPGLVGATPGQESRSRREESFVAVHRLLPPQVVRSTLPSSLGPDRHEWVGPLLSMLGRRPGGHQRLQPVALVAVVAVAPHDIAASRALEVCAAWVHMLVTPSSVSWGVKPKPAFPHARL